MSKNIAAERLSTRLQDRSEPLRLYGSTPPRMGSTDELVNDAAEKLIGRLRGLSVDGLVVYDIQDESGRTSIPRPFPFTGTVEPRAYSRLLMERSGFAAINYKSLGGFDEPQWQAWLDETTNDYGLHFLSIVGRPTSGVHYSLSLPQAIAHAKQHPAKFCLGGVLIAERDTPTQSEADRLLTKGAEGCSYFISQTVYHAEPTIRVLQNYLRGCKEKGVTPRRIVFTFAPCGRDKTMSFIKWLGVRVTAECERTILGAVDPLRKSIEICRDNLREILDQGYASEIPLGINVESVSINRDEIDATVELFGVLSEVLKGR
ncbi:MAG TPA: hypothetical protein VJU83_00220 [Burkholderiales bacterium]|nr:hypothetical protein [Burkholderiales bacterium]